MNDIEADWVLAQPAMKVCDRVREYIHYYELAKGKKPPRVTLSQVQLTRLLNGLKSKKRPTKNLSIEEVPLEVEK